MSMALAPQKIDSGASTSFWSAALAALGGVAVLGLPKDDIVADEWLGIELGTLLFY
ncbi:MAG: hypothetical protein ACT4PP_03345 [Sporichthyaceae bacterium]